MKKIFLLFTTVFLLFIFSGCVQQTRNLNKYKPIDLKVKVLDRINLLHSKDLKTVLKELGEIEHKEYHLSKDSKDLIVPSVNNPNILKIQTFFDLQNYIQTLLNYKIYVAKNEFFTNRVKIVKTKFLGKKKKEKEKVIIKYKYLKPKKKIIKYSFIKTNYNNKLNLNILNLASLTKLAYYNFNKINKKEIAKLIIEKSKHYKYLDTKMMKIIFLNKKYTRKDLKDLYTTLKIKGLK